MKCLCPILQQLATTSFPRAVKAARADTAKGSARLAWGYYWSTVLALWCTCDCTGNVCNACCCWLLCIQLCRSPASCQPPGSTSHQLPPLLWHNTLQSRQIQLAASASVGWCTAARPLARQPCSCRFCAASGSCLDIKCNSPLCVEEEAASP
jgi:hypothetical protein